MKNQYPNTIQIYNSAGFSDDLLTQFLEIFENRRVSIEEKDLFNFVALYESFLAFAILSKKSLISDKATDKESDKKSDRQIDGLKMWSMARGMSFEGNHSYQ